MKLYSKFQKRLAMLAVGAMLTASMSPAIMASDYENHWAKDAIERWSGKDVVEGYADGTFKPKQAITRAELAKIIVQVFGLSFKDNAKSYNDVSADAWYAPYIDAVSSADIMHDDGSAFNPNKSATREEAAYAIAMAYEITDGKSSFKDSDQISDWASEKVAALAANGYISGRTDGNFAPKDTLTRADVITMIDKITADLVNKAGTYSKDIAGNLVVNAGDVVLKDMTISGNLYVAEGVGESDITLDNVEVKGTVFLEGAGENSCHIINGSKASYIKANKANNKIVRIRADKSAIIGDIDIQSACTIAADGNIDSVNVQCSANIKITSGKIGTLKSTEKAKIDVAKSVTITDLILQAVTEITGNGTITNCIIEVNGCKLAMEPKKTIFTNSSDKVTIGSKEVSKTGNSTNTNTNTNTSNTTNTNTTGGNSSNNNWPSNNPTTTPSVIGELKPEKDPVVIGVKKITNVVYQNKVVVAEGTSAAAIANMLPTKVTLSYDDSTTGEVACTWGDLSNITSTGTYKVLGTVSLPSETSDPQDLLKSIAISVVVEKDKLLPPASITILNGQTYIENTDTKLPIQIGFTKQVTTAATLHVQIGNLAAQTQYVTSTSALSINFDLNGVDRLPAGNNVIKAWMENTVDKSDEISIIIVKKAASQMPLVVNSMAELDQAIETATDELLTNFSVSVTGITEAQLANYSMVNNQKLSERVNKYGFGGTKDSSGNMKTITMSLTYKTMYEAIKADSEPVYMNAISFTAQKVLAAAKQVVNNNTTASMTSYEKEIAIHDYIVKNTAYYPGSDLNEKTIGDPIFGAEGVLLNGVAVCQGYAEAMKLLMNLSGVECEVVVGTATNSNGTENHAWNLVKLDDEWYHLDPTWDDPTPDRPGVTSYSYFNMTDAMIKKDHTISSTRTYPAATGTKYFYYANSIVKSEAEAQAKIDHLIDNKQYSGAIYCDYNADGNKLVTSIQAALMRNKVSGSISCSINFGVGGGLFQYTVTPN